MKRIRYDLSDAFSTDEQMQIIIDTLEKNDMLRDDCLYSAVRGGEQTRRLLETGTYRDNIDEEDIIFAFERYEFVGEGVKGRCAREMVLNQVMMHDKTTIVVWDSKKFTPVGHAEYRFNDPSKKLDTVVAVLEEI